MGALRPHPVPQGNRDDSIYSFTQRIKSQRYLKYRFGRLRSFHFLHAIGHNSTRYTAGLIAPKKTGFLVKKRKGNLQNLNKRFDQRLEKITSGSKRVGMLSSGRSPIVANPVVAENSPEASEVQISLKVTTKIGSSSGKIKSLRVKEWESVPYLGRNKKESEVKADRFSAMTGSENSQITRENKFHEKFERQNNNLKSHSPMDKQKYDAKIYEDFSPDTPTKKEFEIKESQFSVSRHKKVIIILKKIEEMHKETKISPKKLMDMEGIVGDWSSEEEVSPINDEEDQETQTHPHPSSTHPLAEDAKSHEPNLPEKEVIQMGPPVSPNKELQVNDSNSTEPIWKPSDIIKRRCTLSPNISYTYKNDDDAQSIYTEKTCDTEDDEYFPPPYVKWRSSHADLQSRRPASFSITPKKKRGRPPKIQNPLQTQPTTTVPKRGRGRPRKIQNVLQTTTPKKARGRPRKIQNGLQPISSNPKKGRPYKIQNKFQNNLQIQPPTQRTNGTGMGQPKLRTFLDLCKLVLKNRKRFLRPSNSGVVLDGKLHRIKKSGNYSSPPNLTKVKDSVCRSTKGNYHPHPPKLSPQIKKTLRQDYSRSPNSSTKVFKENDYYYRSVKIKFPQNYPSKKQFHNFETRDERDKNMLSKIENIPRSPIVITIDDDDEEEQGSKTCVQDFKEKFEDNVENPKLIDNKPVSENVSSSSEEKVEEVVDEENTGQEPGPEISDSTQNTVTITEIYPESTKENISFNTEQNSINVEEEPTSTTPLEISTTNVTDENINEQNVNEIQDDVYPNNFIGINEEELEGATSDSEDSNNSITIGTVIDSFILNMLSGTNSIEVEKDVNQTQALEGMVENIDQELKVQEYQERPKTPAFNVQQDAVVHISTSPFECQKRPKTPVFNVQNDALDHPSTSPISRPKTPVINVQKDAIVHSSTSPISSPFEYQNRPKNPILNEKYAMIHPSINPLSSPLECQKLPKTPVSNVQNDVLDHPSTNPISSPNEYQNQPKTPVINGQKVAVVHTSTSPISSSFEYQNRPKTPIPNEKNAMIHPSINPLSSPLEYQNRPKTPVLNVQKEPLVHPSASPFEYQNVHKNALTHPSISPLSSRLEYQKRPKTPVYNVQNDAMMLPGTDPKSSPFVISTEQILPSVGSTNTIAKDTMSCELQKLLNKGGMNYVRQINKSSSSLGSPKSRFSPNFHPEVDNLFEHINGPSGKEKLTLHYQHSQNGSPDGRITSSPTVSVLSPSKKQKELIIEVSTPGPGLVYKRYLKLTKGFTKESIIELDYIHHLESLYRCDRCNESFAYPHEATSCLKSHRLKKCWICLKTVPYRMGALASHNSVHQTGGLTLGNCPFCKITLPFTLELRHHIELEHFQLLPDQLSTKFVRIYGRPPKDTLDISSVNSKIQKSNIPSVNLSPNFGARTASCTITKDPSDSHTTNNTNSATGQPLTNIEVSNGISVIRPNIPMRPRNEAYMEQQFPHRAIMGAGNDIQTTQSQVNQRSFAINRPSLYMPMPNGESLFPVQQKYPHVALTSFNNSSESNSNSLHDLIEREARSSTSTLDRLSHRIPINRHVPQTHYPPPPYHHQHQPCSRPTVLQMPRSTDYNPTTTAVYLERSRENNAAPSNCSNSSQSQLHINAQTGRVHTSVVGPSRNSRESCQINGNVQNPYNFNGNNVQNPYQNKEPRAQLDFEALYCICINRCTYFLNSALNGNFNYVLTSTECIILEEIIKTWFHNVMGSQDTRHHFQHLVRQRPWLINLFYRQEILPSTIRDILPDSPIELNQAQINYICSRCSFLLSRWLHCNGRTF